MGNNKLTYSQAFDELQQIISALENSEIYIDELDAKIKRASELLKICQTKLFNAEENISNSLAEINAFTKD